MCNTKVKTALLEGHHGPHFKGLENIQRLFKGDLQRLNEVFIETVQTELDTTQKARQLVTTSDDYVWWFGVSYTHYEDSFCILIPGMHNTELTDGTHSDRHAALYYSGKKLSHRELMRIARKITVAFEDAYEDMYGHIT